ncbi:MAG: DUF2490 domain-containing protein [Sphingomonas sp.]|uniref:DUF2490 domain-containing protein n=1 Tax=Sphingomonas sp. TaxID=28214 RepID=UPI0025EDDADA|nr:DUF2490 domain-containing protein [Sphingomonas sp.]MBY0283341.1 DUF2490 domain-containing protein [Sphingomonas sp.]
MKRLLLTVAASTLGLSVPAHAEHDAQAWPVVIVQGKIKDDAIFWLEAQPRITDDAQRLGQLLIRTAIGVQLGKRTSVLSGYAFIRTDPIDRPLAHEHRLWQQLLLPLSKPGARLTVTARTRLEERFVEGFDGVGWRLRQQVRLQHKLPGQSKLSAVLWSEPFYNMNTTDWGQRAGWDQVRTFAGVSIPLSKKVTLEPGYLNQTVLRAAGTRYNHIANVWLVVRL